MMELDLRLPAIRDGIRAGADDDDDDGSCEFRNLDLENNRPVVVSRYLLRSRLCQRNSG